MGIHTFREPFAAFAQAMAQALAVATVVVAVGCQHFPGYSSGSGSGSLSGPTPTQNFIPSVTSAPVDGNGPGQALDLPKGKKIEALLTTAKLMETSGKAAEAAYYYEQIRELDPRRDLFCARHLSVLYDKKGDFDKALDEYGKLLKANPRDADAHNDLGYGYYSRAKFEAAEKSLRIAVDCDPKHKRAWSNLGMTLAQLGRYEESLASFEKVVNRPQALCNIAFIQAAQGKWMEARDSYAMALKLEPGLQKARVALERMQEGPAKKNQQKDMMEARRRLEAGERGASSNNELAGSMPFGAPAGSVGADHGMIYISGDDQPINVPVPGSYSPPPVASPRSSVGSAVGGSAGASAGSDASPLLPPPLPLPPSPSSLSVH